MKKFNNFLFVIGAIIVVAIIVLIFKYILDTTGIINQGYFRINDVVVKNAVNVYDEQETLLTEASSFSDIKLKLSQNNNIYILVTKTDGVDASEIYIDNVSFSEITKQGQITFYQTGNEKQYDFSDKKNKLELNKVDQDGQYLIDLNFNNTDFSTDSKLEAGINSVTYDGTILPLLGYLIKDISCELSFDLNIIEGTGKTNTCKFKLNIPDEKLISEGVVIKRESLDNFNFIVK